MRVLAKERKEQIYRKINFFTFRSLIWNWNSDWKSLPVESHLGAYRSFLWWCSGFDLLLIFYYLNHLRWLCCYWRQADKNIARYKIFMDSTDHIEKTLLNNILLPWKYWWSVQFFFLLNIGKENKID